MLPRLMVFVSLVACGSLYAQSTPYERGAREFPFEALVGEVDAPADALGEAPKGLDLVGTLETAGGINALIRFADGRVLRASVGERLLGERLRLTAVSVSTAVVEAEDGLIHLSLSPSEESIQ